MIPPIFLHNVTKRKRQSVPYPSLCFWKSLHIFLLLLSSSPLVQSLRNPFTASPPNQPITKRPPDKASLLRAFIKARVGDDSHSVWSYQGALYDPLTGRHVCHVQGLELVRCLATTDDENYRQRCGDLRIATELPKVEYAATLLTRKLFCYADDPRHLLRSFRLRPNGPVTRIPTNQAVTIYDTATSFVQPNADSSSWKVHTEFPDGRSVGDTAVAVTSEGNERLEFTVFSRLRGRAVLGGNDAVSPPRSSLVQVGGPSRVETNGRFGARETYQYSLDGATPTVRYTRYGEGPVWYGPHRMLTLELNGRRVQEWSDAPYLVANVAARLVPGILSVHQAVRDPVRVLHWFRHEVPLVLNEDDEVLPRWNRWRRGGAMAWERLRQATLLGPVP